MSTIDLNNPPPNHQFNVSVEREETKSEHALRLFKDLVFFLVAIGFVLVIGWLCVQTIIDPAATPEEQKWAMSVLSAATGGIIGYLVKR